MSNYIRTYEDTVSAILEKFQKATSDEAKLLSLARGNASNQNPGLEIHDPEFFQTKVKAAMDELISRHRNEALEEINKAQHRLKQERQDHEARISRQKMRALSGTRLIEEFAKTHGISEAQAREELEQHARARKGGFDDSIQDRYAAMMNRDSLTEVDLRKLNAYEQDEIHKAGIGGEAETIKNAEHYLGSYPGQVMNEWNTSGLAMLRQMRNQPDTDSDK